MTKYVILKSSGVLVLKAEKVWVTQVYETFMGEDN